MVVVDGAAVTRTVVSGGDCGGGGGGNGGLSLAFTGSSLSSSSSSSLLRCIRNCNCGGDNVNGYCIDGGVMVVGGVVGVVGNTMGGVAWRFRSGVITTELWESDGG